MNACPHCAEKSISMWRKVTATPFWPAICRRCDKASHVSVWSGVLATVATEVLLLVGMVVVILYGGAYGLLVSSVGVIALFVLLARLFPLVPARYEVREVRRRTVRHTTILAGVVVLVSAALMLAIR
ncbi:hypothetical protein [Pseudoxanthomonas sp.]|jgi:hypothetical protein|uniref:hypothetical protein n=1 Tax=Pseudoxanthomonas sp. TaxID=1871049 RepID=UPI002FE1B329